MAGLAGWFALYSFALPAPAQDTVLEVLKRRFAAASEESMAALADFVDRARGAWPTLASADPERVADTLEHRATMLGLDVSTAAQRLDAAELWLCAACAGGSSPALACFESRYIAPLAPALRAMGLDAMAVQDVEQQVRTKLLTPDSEGRLRLLAYVGEGKLGGLVKVVAMRTAIDERRARAHRPAGGGNADASAVERLMAGELGPEMQVVEHQNREVVKEAFSAAIERLSSTDRGILRLHLLERLSIDEIAALHDVHRATAARWLMRLRGRLGEHTREALRVRLGLDPRQLDSLMHAVRSRLDLSLSRVLAPSEVEDDLDRGRP